MLSKIKSIGVTWLLVFLVNSGLSAADYPEGTCAIVNFDKGSSQFVLEDDRFVIDFKRKTQIKILTKEGIDYGTVEILYYVEKGGQFEFVRDISGTVSNLIDGKLVLDKLDNKDITYTVVNDYWKKVQFALPNVREGSTIEYTYTLQTPFLAHLTDWYFQWDIPVTYSEYQLDVVPFYEYATIYQGMEGVINVQQREAVGLPRHFGNITFTENIYTFSARDLPAFHEEEFLSSREDYITKIDFQLSKINYPNGTTREFISTWEKLSTELLDNEYFGKYLKKSEKVAKDFLPVSLLEGAVNAERLESIINYTKGRTTWNHIEKIYAYQDASDIIKRGEGNAAELNLFLTGILTEAGFTAKPVLLSTRNNGKIKSDYPFTEAFNYIIVLVDIDGKNYLIDITNDYFPLGDLPPRCINGNGFVVEKKHSNWVNIENSGTSNQVYTIGIRFNDDLTQVEYDTRIEYTRVFAAVKRSQFSYEYDDLKEELRGSHSSIPDSLVAQKHDSIKEPFVLAYKATDQVSTIDELLLVSPLKGMVRTESPLKQPERSYPIDMIYQQGFKYDVTIDIPRGYKIEQLPKSYSENNRMVLFSYLADSTKDGKVKIITQYRFNNSVYPVSDYKYMRFFYGRLVDKLNEEIVFIRKEPENIAENVMD